MEIHDVRTGEGMNDPSNRGFSHGDLVQAHCPFSGEDHPALVLDITGHEHLYGPYYKLLVTPRDAPTRIDELPADYVTAFPPALSTRASALSAPHRVVYR